MWGPSWPMYGLSDARTRDASGLTDVHPPYHVTWSASVGIIEYPPVYAKGVLFEYANGGFVSARNVFTGKLLWSRALLHAPSTLGQGSPAVRAGVVYVGARDGHIYALSAATGKTIWNRNVGATMESSPAFDFALPPYERPVGRGAGRSGLQTARWWDVPARGAGQARPGGRRRPGLLRRLRRGDVLPERRQRAPDLAQHHRRALVGLRAGNFFSTPAVAYGRVYIGNTDDKLYSFEAATGQVAWTYTMPNWAYGSPAVANGTVYATSFDGTIAALSARTGAVLWQHQLPYGSLSSPTVVGGSVYVADLGPSPSSRGHMYGFNRNTGKLDWQFGDGKYASVIVAAGRLVVSGATHVYVLRPLRS